MTCVCVLRRPSGPSRADFDPPVSGRLAKSCSEPRTCSLTAPAAWCSARCSHPARSCACSRSPWSRGTPRATSRRMPWATGRNSRSRRRAHPLPSSNPPYRTHPHQLAHHLALSLSRLTAPHPIQPSTSYISRLQTPHHLQALGATVTEWRDLPEAAQGIVTAVREKPESVEFDDVISGIDAGYDATEVEFEVNGLKSAPGR